MQFPKKFIFAGPEYSEYDKFVPAPYFRKTFYPGNPDGDYALTVTGLGFYRVWINGTEITKGLLAPYISNPDDAVYFDRYDLSPYIIINEKNVVGFLLGNGMQNAPGGQIWDFDIARHRGAPRLAFALEFYGQRIEADESVKTARSPLYFDDLRAGARYDARKEIPGWNLPGFDDSAWQNALPCESPRGEARLCEAEPIRPTGRILRPVCVVPAKGIAPYITHPKTPVIIDPDGAPTAEGGLLFDFGENNTGVPRLRIHGRPGQKISLQFAEVARDGVIDYSNINFYPDGHAQRDVYVCKGGEECWQPCFTYHGFRFCLVSGVEEGQDFSLEYVVCTSDIPSAASFRCSDDTANRLYEMAERSDRSNFWYFPTDCPHREKNGWTGDAQLSAEHMLLTMKCGVSLREWMRNIRAQQRNDGLISGIVPTAAGWGVDLGPSWDSVLSALPYYTYIYTGDKTILEENADAILAYLHYASGRQKPDGLVEYGLGDWCPVGGNSKIKASREFTNSLSLMVMAEQASFIFDILNMAAEKDYADALYRELRDGLRAKYIDESGTVADGGCQTSQAMAIFYGLFKAGKLKQAKKNLVESIHKNGDFLDVGILGARTLFRVQADADEADLAYKMITRREYPSYGRFIDAGLTTLPECFEIGFPDAEAGSYNHHMFGDIKAWFISCVAGITPNPERSDPDHMLIRPNFISSLDFAEAHYDAPAGRIFVRWERKDGRVELLVRAADGITAEVVLPDGARTAHVGENVYKF